MIEPELKTEMQTRASRCVVEVEFWACGDEYHRHKARETAARCMQKRDGEARKKWREMHFNFRNAVIFGMWASGSRLDDIAATFAITKQRTSQIVARMARQLRHPSRHRAFPGLFELVERKVRAREIAKPREVARIFPRLFE